jgi:NAD(P)-dependent dehydrogenase (short-subunit alcohol dehydrogenase family)
MKMKIDVDNSRFAPLLRASGTRKDPSRIIIVSSTAGKNVPHVGENGTIMYSVSKAAAHVGFHFRDKARKTKLE